MRALRLLPVIAFALAPVVAFAAPQPPPTVLYCPNSTSAPTAFGICGTSGFPFTTSGGGGSSAPYNFTPLGYQQITVSALSTLTIPTGAIFAYLTVETSPIRYRDDGTAPTSTVGYPVAVGTQLYYAGTLSAVQLIAQSGTPVVDVLYYK